MRLVMPKPRKRKDISKHIVFPKKEGYRLDVILQVCDSLGMPFSPWARKVLYEEALAIKRTKKWLVEIPEEERDSEYPKSAEN